MPKPIITFIILIAIISLLYFGSIYFLRKQESFNPIPQENISHIPSTVDKVIDTSNEKD